VRGAEGNLCPYRDPTTRANFARIFMEELAASEPDLFRYSTTQSGTVKGAMLANGQLDFDYVLL
jgi:hypothetical protein